MKYDNLQVLETMQTGCCCKVYMSANDNGDNLTLEIKNVDEWKPTYDGAKQAFSKEFVCKIIAVSDRMASKGYAIDDDVTMIVLRNDDLHDIAVNLWTHPPASLDNSNSNPFAQELNKFSYMISVNKFDIITK